jgi:hypothetical protein
MAILSQATSGQDEIPQNALIEAKNARRASNPSSPMQFVEEDVREVIRGLYEAADAVGSEWLEAKDNKKIVEKGDKKKRYTKAKGKGKMIEKDAADAEEMGEEAAEAVYVGKRKARAKDMGELAVRMGKAKVPDNTLDDESSDEEPVRAAGRLRRG